MCFNTFVTLPSGLDLNFSLLETLPSEYRSLYCKLDSNPPFTVKQTVPYIGFLCHIRLFTFSFISVKFNTIHHTDVLFMFTSLLFATQTSLFFCLDKSVSKFFISTNTQLLFSKPCYRIIYNVFIVYNYNQLEFSD